MREQCGPDAREDRLRETYPVGQTTPVFELTPEASLQLQITHGERGFLVRNSRGQTALYRCIPDAKGNLLEIWFTHPAIFVDPDGSMQKADHRSGQLNLHEQGRVIMELLLGMIGSYRTNPVEVPAEALRVLLWPGQKVPRDWKQIVERTLGALIAVICAWEGGGLKGKAVFVHSWQYLPRGRGGHGEGIYIIGVTQPFIGTLAVFASGVTKLCCGVDATTYDFSKDLSKEQKKQLSYVSVDLARVFCDAAARLTGPQRALAQWIEAEITQNRDAVAKGGRAVRARNSAPQANQPRLYEFILLPHTPARPHLRRGAWALPALA